MLILYEMIWLCDGLRNLAPLSFNLFGVRLQTIVERPLMATWFKPVNRFSCEEKGEKARRGKTEREEHNIHYRPSSNFFCSIFSPYREQKGSSQATLPRPLTSLPRVAVVVRFYCYSDLCRRIFPRLASGSCICLWFGFVLILIGSDWSE